MARNVDHRAPPQGQQPANRNRRQELWAGFSGVAPILVGVIPFGLIYGVLAVDAGLPTSMAQSMSIIVFAGSAQFITTQLLHDHAPLWVIVFTAAIINLRHLLYSASLAPHLQKLNRGWQALLAYLLTDEAYVVTITRYLAPDSMTTPYAHWYFLGTGCGLWFTWQMSTAIGVFLGAQVPAAWSLDFTLPLTFTALIVPAIKDRATSATALVAGVVALVALTMPLKLGLMVAILIAIVVGYGVERWLIKAVEPKTVNSKQNTADARQEDRKVGRAQ